MNPESLLEIIRHRRSIPPSRMRPDPISDEVMKRILQAAHWAPSHRRTFPWRFHLFKGDARRTLGQALARAYQFQAGLTADSGKVARLKAKPLNAFVAIGLVMEPPNPAVNTEMDELLAMGCAVQNLHLQAAAEGLAGYWTTPKYMHDPALSVLMNIVDHAQCVGIFYLGTPTCEWPEGKRPAIDKHIFPRG